jgi:hypothetical protein
LITICNLAFRGKTQKTTYQEVLVEQMGFSDKILQVDDITYVSTTLSDLSIKD